MTLRYPTNDTDLGFQAHTLGFGV